MLRAQLRCGLLVATLFGTFLLSLALEYVRTGGANVSGWRIVGGMLPGLLGLAAVLGVSIAFVRDVYEIPDWRTAFGYTWLLLFGRAPISALDPIFPDIFPYPFAIVQQGEVDEQHQNTLLVRFGGPGDVIVFNDSAVFLERFGHFTRVAGPGRIFLQRFERIHETLDLRPQERTPGADALTKDGIPVKTEVQVRFQLARPPASLVPPTPDVPYPVYKWALIRAGQCHLRSVNLDNGKESIARWPERASGVGGVMRALIAGHGLDELLEPYEPERDPRRKISQRLHREVDAGARGFGAQVLEVRMGALEPTLEEVKEERVTSWQAAWKSKARTEAAAGMAEAIRERGLARAYAQKEIIMAIARELQRAAERGTALPAEFIALRFVEALRQVWASPGGMIMSSQAVHTMDYLQRMVRQDYALPGGEVDYEVIQQLARTYRPSPIPILKVSDGPDVATGQGSDVAGYATATGKFLIAGRTYHLYPLDKATGGKVELKSGAVYFALVVPEDGWLDSASKKGDYALVQWKPPVAQEGPGVLWTGAEWVGGRFERDVATRDIHFVPSRPYIIGGEGKEKGGDEQQGYVVALLKPAF